MAILLLHNVIYKIFNEPAEQTWDDVKTYSTAVINAIRQHDQDNIIIIGCPLIWSYTDLLLTLPKHRKIML